MEVEDIQFKKMTETPINKLILSLAGPTIVSMMITAIYNTADTYFVSKLGTSAAGAVGVVFSLMAILQAIGFTIGRGAGSEISTLLGEKKNKEANEVASSGFISGIVIGLIIMIVGIILVNPLMKLLGATKGILPYAVNYAKYILLAAPMMITTFVLNNYLRSEGKASLAMIGIASGSILNIVLDPLFIYTFNLGISGAALATAVGQFVGTCILLSIYLRRKTVIKISVNNISKRIKVYLEILRYGFPSLCRQGLSSISSVILNVSAASYGDSAVAAMSIVTKIVMLLFSVLIGIGQGYQPVVGYNYGAKKYKRVKESFCFTTKIGTIFMLILGIVSFYFAPNIINLFIKNDVEVLKIGTIAIRMQCLALPFISLSLVCNMTFQSIGQTTIASLLSACRQGIFFIPLILILPNFLGITGIEMTQPIADIFTFSICFVFTLRFFRQLNVLNEECYN